MSITGISNNANPIGSLPYQLTNFQFRQLGDDLTAGNLSAAQSDLSSLQQAFGQIPGTSPASSSNPVAQAFQQLSSDIKSGNLSAAQQDYSAIQQKVNSSGSSSHFHHHHVVAAPEQSTLLQELNQLGQELSSATLLSGNANAVQQAYAAPMQLFAPGGQSGENGNGLQSVSDSAMSVLA